MNRARAIVNDSYRGGAGRILTDTAPFTIEYLNGALEELQDKIGNNGVITLIKDNVILSPITALAAPDPAVQVFVNYQGFFNGVKMIPLPVLPADCISVKKVWERQTGSGLPFQPMTQPMEGLQSCFQGEWLGTWEYRQDAIYMTGSTTTEDLRIRYESRLPVLSSSDSFADTEIAILASVNALANIVAYQYARARGAPAAQVMQADAEKYMRYIVRRYTRQKQSVPYYRQPYEPQGQGGWGTNLPF